MICLPDLHWLAGIVEGEGSISLSGPPGYRRYPQLTVEMSDEDVVRRVAAYWGGKVTKRDRSDRGTKTLYRATATCRKGAFWLLALYPLLGARRRVRIREVLRAYGATRPHIELPKESA